MEWIPGREDIWVLYIGGKQPRAMFRICRYKRLIVVNRRGGTFIGFNSCTDNSTFFSRLSEATASTSPEQIRNVLSSCQNIEQIVESSYMNFVDIVNRKVSQESGVSWQQGKSVLPTCDYVFLLDASVSAQSLPLLNLLIRPTHFDPICASYIGLTNLFGWFMPFLWHHDADSTRRSEVLCALGQHVFHWFYHMHPLCRRTQIETMAYLSRIYFAGSATDILELHSHMLGAHTCLRGDERTHKESSDTIRQNLTIDISGQNSESTTGVSGGGTRSCGDVLYESATAMGPGGRQMTSATSRGEDDEGLSAPSLRALFVLSACRQLSSAGHVQEAASYLRSQVTSGAYMCVRLWMCDSM